MFSFYEHILCAKLAVLSKMQLMKEYDKAIRSYRRGTVSLKGLNNSNTGDDQVKTLLLGLQNNMAMIYAKQEKYKQALDVTKKALEVDSENLKALFRKGQMQRLLRT